MQQRKNEGVNPERVEKTYIVSIRLRVYLQKLIKKEEI